MRKPVTTSKRKTETLSVRAPMGPAGTLKLRMRPTAFKNES